MELQVELKQLMGYWKAALSVFQMQIIMPLVFIYKVSKEDPLLAFLHVSGGLQVLDWYIS